MRFQLPSGLLRKFAAVMVGLALVPVALLAVQLINVSQRGIQAAVLELHTKLAEGMAASVDEYMRTSHQKVAFALASLQKNMEWSDKQDLLQSLIETHPAIIEISMVDGRGRELVKVFNPEATQDAVLHDRSGEAAFQEFRKTRVLTNGEASFKGKPALLTFYPLRGDVSARVLLSLGRLGERVAGERIGGTGFAVQVDEKGRPQLYAPELLDERSREAFPRWSIVSAALQSQSVGSREFTDERGRTWVGAYAPLTDAGAIITLQTRDEAYYAANVMKRTAWAAVFVVLIVGSLAAIWLARALTKPLLELSKAAEAVSRGDFLSTVSIETGDELQELADTFNRMTAQLRAYSVLQVDRLIAEQRKTAAILYSISDGIVMTDKEGRVQLANRRALEIFGLDPEASIEGKTLAETLSPDSGLTGVVLNAAADPKPDVVKDVDLSGDEKRLYIRVTGYPVRRQGASGASLGVVVSMRDITLERELDKMKEEFLHYITHDLRNPLGSAIGFLEMLLKGTPGVLNGEQTSIVSAVKRSNLRLLSMVNNILDIAKMDSGRVRLQLKATSITGVAGRSIAILESMSKAKNIAVTLDAVEEFTIESDGDLVERVFTNLLGNAIKYTPSNGKITVSVADEGNSLRCCVADTGDGIPKEYLEKVFMKFEQVQGQRKGGTGLGLTIARFFVESHLGQIWVESEVGKGSQFYFTIPKALVADAEGRVHIKETAA